MTTASITNSAGAAARAPEPETLERDASRLAALGEQQRGDQITADDEEHLDAEEAAGCEPRLVPADEVVVEREDREHRDRAQAVETRQIAERGRAWFGLRALGPRLHGQCRVMMSASRSSAPRTRVDRRIA